MKENRITELKTINEGRSTQNSSSSRSLKINGLAFKKAKKEKEIFT
jgi:hypothetical protein